VIRDFFFGIPGVYTGGICYWDWDGIDKRIEAQNFRISKVHVKIMRRGEMIKR